MAVECTNEVIYSVALTSFAWMVGLTSCVLAKHISSCRHGKTSNLETIASKASSPDPVGTTSPRAVKHPTSSVNTEKSIQLNFGSKSPTRVANNVTLGLPQSKEPHEPAALSVPVSNKPVLSNNTSGTAESHASGTSLIEAYVDETGKIVITDVAPGPYSDHNHDRPVAQHWDQRDQRDQMDQTFDSYRQYLSAAYGQDRIHKTSDLMNEYKDHKMHANLQERINLFGRIGGHLNFGSQHERDLSSFSGVQDALRSREANRLPGAHAAHALPSAQGARQLQTSGASESPNDRTYGEEASITKEFEHLTVQNEQFPSTKQSVTNTETVIVHDDTDTEMSIEASGVSVGVSGVSGVSGMSGMSGAHAVFEPVPGPEISGILPHMDAMGVSPHDVQNRGLKKSLIVSFKKTSIVALGREDTVQSVHSRMYAKVCDWLQPLLMKNGSGVGRRENKVYEDVATLHLVERLVLKLDVNVQTGLVVLALDQELLQTIGLTKEAIREAVLKWARDMD